MEHGESGGYSEEQLGPDRYSVAFAGNTLTSRERVEQYMLFRAAEFSLRDGYDGFRMVYKTTECDRQTITERAPGYDATFGPASARPSWRYYYDGRWTNWYPYDDDPFDKSRTETRMIERFEAHAEIELLRAPLDVRKYGVFGTQGNGVADVLVAPSADRPVRDFTGTLPYAWPTDARSPVTRALFARGFGLSYAKRRQLGTQSEYPAIDVAKAMNVAEFFVAGRARSPWVLSIADAEGKRPVAESAIACPRGALAVRSVDMQAQKDGKALV